MNRDQSCRKRSARPSRRISLHLCSSLFPLLLAISPAIADPFADEVISFAPGSGAGFGADHLPDVVLGPPRGAGENEGSFDVVSLGSGGSIVVALRDGGLCDGPGPDFTVFENAFRAAGGSAIFTEVGIVAVSGDGVHFVEFPYDVSSFAGLAGKTPVYSNPENGIDPLDAAVAGGDSFDLADVGMESAVYVRLTDGGDAIPDLGNRVPPGNSGGFDLDAIASLHACTPGSASPTRSSSPTASSTPTATPSGAASRRPTPTSTPDHRTPTLALVPGDVNGDGDVDESDTVEMIAEMFDGDGDSAAAAAGGLIASRPGVDRNRDGIVAAADLLPME